MVVEETLLIGGVGRAGQCLVSTLYRSSLTVTAHISRVGVTYHAALIQGHLFIKLMYYPSKHKNICITSVQCRCTNAIQMFCFFWDRS